jgi:hypothetical protein
VIKSLAYLKVGPDGLAGVNASLYLTGRSRIQCCTYADQAPILALDDQCVSVAITAPSRDRVTAGDLDIARRLAKAVETYVSDLERRIEAQDTKDAATRAA